VTAIPENADTSAAGVRAVLFDLDDTLFDHHHGAEASLRSVHRLHDCFRGRPFEEIDGAHRALLEQLHADVMVGRLDVDAARMERFRRLFLTVGVAASDSVVRETAAAYRRAYLDARRPIDGAAALLARVRARSRVVIVSNNVADEQRGKLRHCGLDALIDALVVSEEEGISKPDPRIFLRALARVGCEPREAVMFGDSWAADIAGARAAGLRAIWFNRHGHSRPEPDDDVVEIRSLEPVEPVLEAIFPPSRVQRFGEASVDAHRR
jgi:HAD superfamily hydrolase (TIGR01509 family)